MSDFEDSYVGKLREQVGNQLLLLIGARIFIEDEAGQILMQQRADFGKWGFPGGLAEPGERLEDTIRREVTEESGLTLGLVTPIAFSSDPAIETLTYPNGHKAQFYCLMFWTRDYSGEVSVRDNETLQFAWRDPETCPDVLEPMKYGFECFKAYKATERFQVR